MISAEIENAETVGSVAARDYRKAEVFRKLGIDFCCCGNKTLKKASEEAGITEEELRLQLEQVNECGTKVFSPDFDKWELNFLTDYIYNTHHRYIKENVSLIIDLAKKVAKHHEQNHPELTNLQINIQRFLEAMVSHMRKEEEALFPKIRQLVANTNDSGQKVNWRHGFLKNVVWIMQKEHEDSGRDLHFFHRITHNYLLPADACNSYNLLFQKMKEFEDDLVQHIHLENNILFPKAIALDDALAATN